MLARQLKNTVVIFLVVILVLSPFQFALAQRITLKEAAEFFWEFVLKTDKEATYGQLQDVVNLLERYDLDKISAVVANDALSNRQKAEKVDEIIDGNQKYGVVAAREGDEYEGIVSFDSNTINFSLVEGGKTSITLDQIIEITVTEYLKPRQYPHPYPTAGVIKKNNGQLMKFSDPDPVNTLRVDLYCQELGRITIESPKRIILGSVKQIQCPTCWETMEIDWNYCPYDGTKLNIEGVSPNPLSNPSSSQGSNNTNTEEIVGRGNLKLVITTPPTAVFSLGRKDLIVTLDGPATFDKTISDVPTASPETIKFNNIPQGIYTVTATYGNKEISKQIQVGEDTLEFRMVMH